MLDDYFKTLEEWKKLPAYKLETRIDSLVGYALPGVLEHLLSIKPRAVIPELPIRVGTIQPERESSASANRSYKVDFYVRSQGGENIFVEFKSDRTSRREEQDEYLEQSIAAGMRAIVEGILALTRASPYHAKYQYLLERLALAGALDQANNSYVGTEVIRLVYIQPYRLAAETSAEIVDFAQLAAAIRARYGEWDVMRRFAESLEVWSGP